MRVLLPLAALLLGCPKRVDGPAVQVSALLAEADRAWDERGRAGFGPVDTALQAAWALQPESAEVLWRLARLRVGQGQVESDPLARVSAFGAARGLAWSCVRAEPRFQAMEAERGLAAAVAELPVERQLCGAWAAYAWARWMVDFGPAAATADLEALDAVARGASGWTDGDARDRATWAHALTLAARPTWAGRDLDGARARFDAIGEDDDLELRVDRFLWVEAADDHDGSARERVLHARPDTPEERALLTRLR